MLENLQCVTEFSCSNRDYPCERRKEKMPSGFLFIFIFLFHFGLLEELKNMVFISPSVFSDRARKKINLKLCLEI